MNAQDAEEIGNQLCAAALAGDLARARGLIGEGADSSHAFVGDEFLRGDMREHLCWPGNTPLAEAIRGGHTGMVRLLVEAGADPNAPVAAAFGTWPDRVKDRPLTWWMRFALEYRIEGDNDQGLPAIRPEMIPVGCALIAAGASPCLGAVTPRGGEGPGMDVMMEREGLAGELDRMRALASRDKLNIGTRGADQGEQAIERL